jgi:hypothetical protein
MARNDIPTKNPTGYSSGGVMQDWAIFAAYLKSASRQTNPARSNSVKSNPKMKVNEG